MNARMGGRGSAAAAIDGFAGISPDLEESVAKLEETEPKHPEPDVTFTHHSADVGPLTLTRMVLGHRRLALWSVVFLTVESVGFQTGPYLTQIGIDKGLVEHRSLRVIVGVSIVYLVSVAVTVVAERARVRSTGKLAADVMSDLRVRVFAHIQRLSLDHFTEEKAGVTMTRMTSDIEALQALVQDGLAQFLIQGLTMVIVASVLFSYDAPLAALTLGVLVPVLLAASLWFRAASERTYLWVRDALAGVISDVVEGLSGVRVVASHNRQRNNLIHHRNVLGEYRAANRHAAKISAVYSTASDFIGLAGQLFLLLVGGAMVLHSVKNGRIEQHPALTVGELTAFILYLGAFVQPIQQLVQLYNAYQQGQTATRKLRTMLATPPTVAERPDAYDLPAIEGRVELRGVSFGYDPEKLVLRDVDLSIEPGELVAFVGPTGAGKSTIAKLVTRFYDPVAGSVLVDGHDLRDVTIASLRRQLGVVPQEPFLFSGTIRENVSFARPISTAVEIDDAIAAVGLAQVVARLPEGLDTQVHERGQSLASGERQLIALARALLAAPRILVLDEATSNVDLGSEAQVEAGLARVRAGRTAILIAHRLSTAMRADRIVVVAGGRIAEVGTHDELIAAGSLYAELFATWSRQHGGDL